jgi:medium-chain acyl-[acyl-carrier-protein] hydrolase
MSTIIVDDGSNSFLKLNEVSNPEQIWICFHYLGGSGSVYYQWKSKIPKNIQLYALQLPGRDSRKNESFFTDFEELIDVYFNVLLNWNFNLPFVFYGHSMGALIAYELMSRLEQLSSAIADHRLVISASKAPHCITSNRRKVANLTDEDLIAQLCSYGGTPQAVLEDKILLQSFVPRLRADSLLLESYSSHSLRKLKCPIYTFGGTDDPYVPLQSLERWSECTELTFKKKIFAGGHFFVNAHLTELIQEIYHF